MKTTRGGIKRTAALAMPVVALAALAAGAPAATRRPALDRDAERWVQRTLKRMTLDEQAAQLLVPALNSTFTSVDSDRYDKLRHFVRDLKVGGVHVFGGGEPVPQELLNVTYTGARKGDPYAAAVLLNRLQSESALPLLATADFEGGAGYIINGATRLPRAMVLGAAGDPELAYRAGRLSAEEGRALGVHIDFFPVVDVNNNPRNPVINFRSFGENVELVSRMTRAYVRGIQDGGMIATAKHFPGHGDTATDTHLGMAEITHPRERLEAVELAPFRAAIEEGVGAVMTSHISLPALEPKADPPHTPPLDVMRRPATLSPPILTGLLREQMGFDGLIITDSMSMHAISKAYPPDQAAALAVIAGADIVLDPPDPDAALRGIRAAIQDGRVGADRIRRSAERILRAKARLGLHRARTVDLAAIDTRLGGRTREKVAVEMAGRGVTLLKDDHGHVPLRLPREAQVLYLSVLDYGSGWREGVPSRTMLAALRERWPAAMAAELTDRTPAAEVDLLRALAQRADAVVAAVFVRVASYSGRMDLTPGQAQLLEGLGTLDKPYVTVLFGNPYSAASIQQAPALLLTYEYSDAVERAAARALLGEAPIAGRLPVTLPGLFPAGHGLRREAN